MNVQTTQCHLNPGFLQQSPSVVISKRKFTSGKEISNKKINTPRLTQLFKNKDYLEEDNFGLKPFPDIGVNLDLPKPLAKLQSIAKTTRTAMDSLNGSSSSPGISDPIPVSKTWTSEEDQRRLTAIKKYGNEWNEIANQIPGKTRVQCRSRKYTLHRRQLADLQVKTPQPWTSAEDATLRIIHETHKKLPSKVIAKELPGRTYGQCNYRWNNYLRGGIVQWTPDELTQLYLYTKRYGKKWSMVAQEIPGKSTKDCRSKWNTDLRHQCSKKAIRLSHNLSPHWFAGDSTARQEISEKCWTHKSIESNLNARISLNSFSILTSPGDQRNPLLEFESNRKILPEILSFEDQPIDMERTILTIAPMSPVQPMTPFEL